MRRDVFRAKEIAKVGHTEFELSYDIYFDDGTTITSKLKVNKEVVHWLEMFEIIKTYYNADLTL